jgi:peptide/nickel transport system ATP-binding protein
MVHAATSASCTVRGSVLLGGRDLLRMGRRELQAVRGREIGMVFQDPMTSLHPSLRVVDQVAEALLVHDTRLSARQAGTRALDLLEQVGVPHVGRRLRDYPHQWSGGMRQRGMVAMAVANSPRLLVADEPTTALDVTIQAQILDVLRAARDDVGAAAVLITHDLGVVAEMADRVTVMQAGRVVEQSPVERLFAAPAHPHTVTLLRALPRLDAPLSARPPVPVAPVLQAEDLVTHYTGHAGSVVPAVDGISLSLSRGETLGLVGESGCGKSTLARTLLRLVDPTAGRILFQGRDITGARGRALRPVRRSMSMVFQDPYASLNPRMTAGEIVAQPLRIAGSYRAAGGRRRVSELLDLVSLAKGSEDRLPSELSGGQRQRIGIARALALSPELLVLDEPVSSLDVSIQAQVVDLLDRLQRELGLAYLFIAHDLALVRQLSDRVAVMYLGKVVEAGTREQVYARPTHPYTQSLLSAVPLPEPVLRGQRRRILLAGEVPDPTNPPSGCRFRTRCWKAQPECAHAEPELVVRPGSDHATACLYADAGAGAGRPTRCAATSAEVDHLGAFLGHLGEDDVQSPQRAADAGDLLLGHLTGVHAGRSKGDEERRVLERRRTQRPARRGAGHSVRPGHPHGVARQSDLGVQSGAGGDRREVVGLPRRTRIGARVGGGEEDQAATCRHVCASLRGNCSAGCGRSSTSPQPTSRTARIVVSHDPTYGAIAMVPPMNSTGRARLIGVMRCQPRSASSAATSRPVPRVR